MSAPHAQPAHITASPDIVHFVGELTPVVLSYLQPAAQALDRAGFQQHIVVVSASPTPLPVSDFGSRTQLSWVTSPSRFNRWVSGLSTLTGLLKPQPPAGVHLHGFIPFCLGGMSLRREGYTGHIYYSPHGSRAHGKLGLLGSLAYSLVSPWIGGNSFLVIADSAGDPANKLPGHSDVVEIVGTPISEAYFETEHMEAPEAIVVGGSSEATAADVNAFCQMTVMMPRTTQNGTRVRYFWTGPVLPEQEAVLKAAEIERVAPSDQTARIELLSMAWLFLAPISGRGYPLPLAQAMACGVPCVAVDAPEHRALIRHGADGLLFQAAKQGLAQATELLETTDRRQALGRMAAVRIQSTRTRSAFETQVVPLYKDSASDLKTRIATPS